MHLISAWHLVKTNGDEVKTKSWQSCVDNTLILNAVDSLNVRGFMLFRKKKKSYWKSTQVISVQTGMKSFSDSFFFRKLKLKPLFGVMSLPSET